MSEVTDDWHQLMMPSRVTCRPTVVRCYSVRIDDISRCLPTLQQRDVYRFPTFGTPNSVA